MGRRKTGFYVAPLLALLAALAIAGVMRSSASAAGKSGYHVVKTIPIGGEGGWDYCFVDSGPRRVYVSHATHVVVLDADSGGVVGDIPDTPGVHGVAVVHELGRGFVSNGRANTVTIFDLKTLKAMGTVKTGQNPDAIFYDAASKRVFAFNGRSNDATAINAADGTVAGTLAVGGKPEFAAGEGNGRVFVNVEDTSELLEIDAQKLAVLHRWPLAPCKSPSGLAMDAKNRRLFAVCENEMMAVVNADTGKVVATPAIGAGPDAAEFDPETQLAFSSNGQSGTLTVVHEDSPDKYSVIDTVPTKRSARTMALDAKTHNIFVPFAEFEENTPAGQRRPPIKPGTFALLVAGK